MKSSITLCLLYVQEQLLCGLYPDKIYEITTVTNSVFSSSDCYSTIKCHIQSVCVSAFIMFLPIYRYASPLMTLYNPYSTLINCLIDFYMVVCVLCWCRHVWCVWSDCVGAGHAVKEATPPSPLPPHVTPLTTTMDWVRIVHYYY